MANLEKVVYLTEAQKETLFTNGTLTANGNTITYNDNDLYITPKEGEIVRRALDLTSIRTSHAGASGETPRYIPGKWHIDTGADPQNGDIYVVQTPEASTGGGIYLSVHGTADTDYHPIILNTTAIMTTHFAAGTTLMLVYESDSIGSAYELEPTTNSKENITGVFRVLNFYDANTNTLLRTYASSSANELPIPGMASSTSMGVPSHTSSYKDIYGGIPATAANRPVIKLSTGVLRSPAGIELGTSSSKNGSLVFHNSSNANEVSIAPGTVSSDITITLPSSTGTLALKSDIKAVQTGSITLSATWSGSGPYTQTVTVSGCTITANSKIDLQPDATVLGTLISDNVQGLFISNNNGTLTATAVGAKPSTALTVQCTITEVGS